MEYIAKVTQVYGTRQRQVKKGQRFHVEPKDVPILKALGRIDDVGVDQPAQGYRTRAMTARKT